MRTRSRVGAGLAAGAAFVLAIWGWAQGQHTEHAAGTPPPTPSKPPVRITMEALHKSGGVPKGWKFSLPVGNVEAGRKVFVDLGCYSCHEVKGEQFPEAQKTADQVGPDLTGMGGMHPGEYLAESIVNPNAVILEEPGFTGPDRLSKMPSFNEDMTVAQLIDLVAYLKSLTGDRSAPASSPKRQAPSGGHQGH